MKRGRQSADARDARREQMLSLIRQRGKIRVEELAELFNVSLMTVRRDLQALEEQGRIGRFYGGASTQSSPEQDAVTLYRRLIGRYAASLVENGDHLFINGSSTALDLLEHTGQKTVHVFTNNGRAVEREFPAGVEITVSGGSLRGHGHIMTGDCTMRNLLMMKAEKTFIGCTGISPDGAILCGIPAELGINETMISHADVYYILADHSKIGKTGTYASFSLEKPGTIITDERAPADVVARLRSVGMTVIQVRESDFPDDSDGE